MCERIAKGTGIINWHSWINRHGNMDWRVPRDKYRIYFIIIITDVLLTETEQGIPLFALLHSQPDPKPRPQWIPHTPQHPSSTLYSWKEWEICCNARDLPFLSSVYAFVRVGACPRGLRGNWLDSRSPPLLLAFVYFYTPYQIASWGRRRPEERSRGTLIMLHSVYCSPWWGIY